MTTIQMPNEWGDFAFIAGFVFAFLAVFLLGLWLGRRSSKPSSNYKASPQLTVELRTLSSSEHHTATIDTETRKEALTAAITPSVANEGGRLLHQQMGQLELRGVAIRKTPEFEHALRLMNDSRSCIFITGEAGTGKSTLLKYFVASAKKRVVVLSPTGVAAINVGGQTIHSFFKFPPRAITPSEITKQHGEIYSALDAIIIDEISMVRADLIDAVDIFLRINRDCPDQPFGGAQIIMFGDLFQLPPVVKKSEEGQFFSQYYRSPYFFDAHVFDQLHIQLVKLKTIFRQEDPIFIEILNNVRINRIDSALLSVLNQRVNPFFEPRQDEGYIVLTTTNRHADAKNLQELAKLPGDSRIYQGNIEGKFDEAFYPTDLQLHLKVGAQVMMLTNDTGKRWFNGTVGIVEELNDEIVKVSIPKPAGQPSQICEVGHHNWQVPQYQIDHSTRTLTSTVIGTFTQFPLRLAWAITIHKSQGKTLERVILDLTDGAFAHGQTYVALSRCTRLNGLVLKKEIHQRDIIVDNRVFGFLNRLQMETSEQFSDCT